MFLLAYGLRGYLLWARVVPSDHEDLTEAAWLRINYWSSSRGQASLAVTDPAQVRELLNTLKVRTTNRRRYYSYSSGSGTVNIEFHFEDGAVIHTQITSSSTLTRNGWGKLTMDPGFYGRIRELIKKADRSWTDPFANTSMDSK
jgi:hypothetical protein